MKGDKTIKLKIVESLAGEAFHSLRKAIEDADIIGRRFPDRHEGVGLGLACLREKLIEAQRLIDLLR